MTKILSSSTKKKMIVRYHIVLGTPQQNGIVQRKNKTLLERA